MRDRYFSMYQSIKYKECYYAAHQEKAHKLYSAYTVIMAALSIFSVLLWSISKTMPALWAMLIAAAQFAQALSSYLPWAKQLGALKYLMPELAQLSLDIDHDWLALDLNGYPDARILKLISMYEDRFEALEKQFANDVDFARTKGILKKAELAQRNHFYIRYPEIKELERRETANAG